MTTAPARLEWALYLAGLGWHVFPLAPASKKPAFPDHPAGRCDRRDPRCRDGHQGWEQRATADPERIARCWQANAYNIGVATGPSGLVVIDLDTADDTGPDGVDELAELADRRGVQVPATYTVTTPSGGRHLYFASPPGVRLRNSAGTLAPHIDTRAHGGYVVAPNSALTTQAYELADDTPPVELPAWIIHALLDRPTTPARPARLDTAHIPAYIAAAIRGETDRVRQATPGQHNATLSRAAFALGQLAGAGLLDLDTARAELLTAAEALTRSECRCTPREAARVIDASLVAGAHRPRTLQPRKDTAA